MIRVSKLEKRYGTFTAVSDLNFSVGKGMIYGLLGPNGAGKTTTLRMLAGILEPTHGSVEVAGVSFDGNRDLAKSEIGFLSADTQLYERSSGRELLWFFGRLYGREEKDIADRIDELTEELQLADYIDRWFGQLSSGQKQRINIARTLVHRPKVLILDEVTASLDVMSSQFVIEQIRSSRERGGTVIFSTHIMGEAEYLCDRIGLIYGGRLMKEGSLQEILKEAGESNLTDAFLALVEKQAS